MFFECCHQPRGAGEGLLHVLLHEDGQQDQANIPQLQLEGVLSCPVRL